MLAGLTSGGGADRRTVTAASGAATTLACHPPAVRADVRRRRYGAPVPGLLRQVREQVPQVSARVTDPAGLGGEPEQGLHDRERDQLRVAERRRDAPGGPAGCELR
jgi:hypothetical protein